jgi:hypothetical protein
MADGPFRAPGRDLQAEAAADKASIENEWERMQGIGRRIRRKKIIAGAVASAIFLVGVVCAAAVAIGTDDPDTRRGARGKAYAITTPLVVAWMIAAAVGKKMWPKGFGVR